MVTLIGLYSPDQRRTFEKYAREAIAHYPELRKRVKFLEGINDNYFDMVEKLKVIMIDHGLEAQVKEFFNV